MKPRKSIEVKGSVGVRLRETDLKKHGHTRCELCVAVKGSIEVRQSIEVKESIETKEEH